jgi:hypothetical protein
MTRRPMRSACCCVQTESWLGGILGVVAISRSLLATAVVRLAVIAHFLEVQAHGHRDVKGLCNPAKEVTLAARRENLEVRASCADTVTIWVVLHPRLALRSWLIVMCCKSVKINYQREVIDPKREHGLADRRADLERRALDLYVEIVQRQCAMTTRRNGCVECSHRWGERFGLSTRCRGVGRILRY